MGVVSAYISKDEYYFILYLTMTCVYCMARLEDKK